MATLVFQGTMTLSSKAVSPGGSGLDTVDGIGPDENGNAQLNADSYCGTWSSDATYRLNNRVSATLNGVPGEYVCLVESTTASISDGTAWKRLSGPVGSVDGVSAGSDGVVQYNRIQDVAAETVTPQFNGELSQTLNIATSTEVNVSSLANTLFNTNPAAVLRLVISADDAIAVTFTGTDNYWLADGTYGTVPPVFNIAAATPTIIEAINITHAAAPGVQIQQTYPVETSNGSGGDIVLPEFNMPGCQAYCSYNGVTTAEIKPGETIQGGELRFSGIASNEDLGIVNSTVAVLGTLQCRGYVFGDYATIECVASFVRIDGTNLMPVSHMLQATAASEHVRNCRYSSADNNLIDCEVLAQDTWYQFTASASDGTQWGPVIYANAVAGLYGDVLPYNTPEDESDSQDSIKPG